MGLNILRDRLALLQLSNGDGKAYLVKFANGNYDAPNLIKLLLTPEKEKIFHFARFDLAIIKKYFGIDLTNVFCTKIASFLVRTYSSNHGLKELCKELLGISISKAQQTSYWGGGSITEEQKEYAAKDVLYLHKIRNILKERLILENREQVAKQIFNFLVTRVNLDLMGWQEVDIFAHSI